MEDPIFDNDGDSSQTVEEIEEKIKHSKEVLSQNRYKVLRGALLEDIGKNYFMLYRRGKLEALDEAIANARNAVDTSIDDFLRERRSINRVYYLLERGQVSDIEDAIVTSEDNARNGTRQKELWLGFLADGLVRQYTWTGNMIQLNHAIKVARESVPGEYKREDLNVTRWMTLAQCLRERFLRTKNMKNIDEAISIVRKVVDSPPTESPDPGNYLHNLAILVSDRYEQMRASSELDEAIEIAQRAVKSRSARYPSELASMLNGVANLLASRYKRTSSMDDLDQAAEMANKAVNLTPDGYPDRVHFLDTLASCLSDRYDQTNAEDDRIKSIEYSQSVFHSNSIMPVRRVSAARQAIRLYAVHDQYPEASDLAEKALEILPMVCSRYLSRADQQYATIQTAGLAADACSLVLKAHGDPNKALEYLEHGRGLIIGHLIDNRRDISRLRKENPRLGDRYGKLRAKALMPLRLGESSDDRFAQMQEAEETAASLEGCLRDIREKVEGFGRFLLPPPSDELLPHSKQGSIVLVNVTHISSDALIVRPSGVTPLKLPNFRAPQVQKYRAWNLTKGTRNAMADKETQQDKRYRRFLAHLWRYCVRLVLDELGYLRNNSSTAELPRIWWIGTGMASSLPFHAAGIHSKDNQYIKENAFEYVISSYTPSIKALGYARERAANPKATIRQSLLLVTMRTTPGMKDLPGVDEERKRITIGLDLEEQDQDPQNLLDDVRLTPRPRAKDLEESQNLLESAQLMLQPHAQKVLHALRSHNIVHFACHGSSDLLDPSNSFLALQGTKVPSTLERLTVRQILDSRLRRSWLAYLSACSTAQNKVEELADEALHLASGFQVAGFAHTIASMWPSNDEICAEVAATFYDELLTKGGIVKDGSRAVAMALNTAVMQVRSKHLDKPLLWAQYIHLGS